MDYDGSADGMSVGKALENNVAFSVTHPLYRALSDAMEAKVAEFAAEKGAQKAYSVCSYVTVALPSEDLVTLAELFPEFRMVTFAFSQPASAMYTQFRRLSLEWCLLQVKRVATSVTVLGSCLVSGLQAGFDTIDFYTDVTSVVAVHERHAMALDAYRLYADHVEVSEMASVPFLRSEYDEFLRGGRYRVITSGEDMRGSEALCVDGFMYSHSPWQVASAMLASGAEVAVGFIPYHPVMLVDERGDLPGFGVVYERTEDSVNFQYSDGVAGCASYPLDVWRSWLVGHTFSLGKDEPQWFQLELLKNRGCAMFYRMVRLGVEPEDGPIVHALDLPMRTPTYVVSSRRLKSLAHDPALDDSWTHESYFYSQRLVDRAYQFAMQLPREQFTRYAIRKQLHVANDRITIEGTSVKVNSALGEKMLDALVVDLFARCFVDRFDAGTLTDKMRAYVDTFSGFGTMSLSEKLWFVATTCSLAAWEVTLAPLNAYVRVAADALRDWFSRSAKLPVPVFRVAPSYVLVGAAESGLDLTGGSLAAREIDRRAACGAQGLLSEFVRTLGQLVGPPRRMDSTGFKVKQYALFGDVPQPRKEVEDTLAMIRTLNPVDEAPHYRRSLEVASVARVLSDPVHRHFNPVADPVWVLNEFYSTVLPGVAEQNLEYDTASISLDPQDRTLAAPYMRLPKYFGEMPRPKLLYQSKLRALNVPKRQQTLQELVSAIAARNLNAPQVALPQDDRSTALMVWENFLNEACVPDARDKLAGFVRDGVGLSEDAFREWVEQSTPAKLEAVKRELKEQSRSLGEMDVGDYMVMLKADVKPTLSTKPISARTEPQVIVYHEKALSALYSSVFRVLVRRFLSLLKPNYHVNLLKDTKDVEAFVRGVHPFGAGRLKYLENDFSKYDKSQGRFVFCLEELVFSQLGMNSDLLRQWLGGHVECNLRAVSLGLSLHVLYQRKSGDATTSFGNVVLNTLSVSYAYRGTDVVWALFMGDDSLVCARAVAHAEDAVQVLAEVFNLGAKTYMTDAPYFASNFVLIDEVNRGVHFIADPVKRIERWSMAVSGDDPQWHERFVSAGDSMGSYLDCASTVLLPRMVAERYDVSADAVKGVADAIATVVADEGKFRAMWEQEPVLSNY